MHMDNLQQTMLCRINAEKSFASLHSVYSHSHPYTQNHTCLLYIYFQKLIHLGIAALRNRFDL